MATLPALTNTDTTLLARLNIRVTLPLYLGISGPLVCMHEGSVVLFPGGARGLFRVCYTGALLLRIPDPTCTQCIISGTPSGACSVHAGPLTWHPTHDGSGHPSLPFTSSTHEYIAHFVPTCFACRLMHSHS